MRPLVIDGGAKKRIAEVIEFARANKISIEEYASRIRSGIAIAEHPGYVCEIPVGFKVCFSIEQHPGGWVRHISASVETRGMEPSLVAMNMLLEEFGFRERVPGGEVAIYREGPAINVVELIDECGRAQ